MCRNVVRCHGLLLIPASTKGLEDQYSGTTLGMLLDYAEGGNLRNLVASQVASYSPVYTFVDAMSILTDIASALAYMHTLDPPLVHRDIKQENMLIRRGEGTSNFRACVADYGLHVVGDCHCHSLLAALSCRG